MLTITHIPCKFNDFRVQCIISTKPQPKLINLKFWQIYLILSFEVNHYYFEFSYKLGIFWGQLHFLEVNIICMLNSKKPVTLEINMSFFEVNLSIFACNYVFVHVNWDKFEINVTKRKP
jgi:hypothetical protein